MDAYSYSCCCRCCGCDDDGDHNKMKSKSIQSNSIQSGVFLPLKPKQSNHQQSSLLYSLPTHCLTSSTPQQTQHSTPQYSSSHVTNERTLSCAQICSVESVFFACTIVPSQPASFGGVFGVSNELQLQLLHAALTRFPLPSDSRAIVPRSIR